MYMCVHTVARYVAVGVKCMEIMEFIEATDLACTVAHLHEGSS